MIDNKNLRQNLEDVKNNLVLKGYNLDVDTFNQLEKQRKSLQIEVESLQAKRNDLSSQFGKAKANGDDVSNLSEEISNVNSKLKDNEDQLKPILNSIQNFLLEIPNIPDISTPAGNSEEDNVVIKTWGKIDKLIGSDHLEITKDIDSDLAAVLAGSRFSVLRGKIAKLHRALIQFMLDEADANGYEECYVPYITNSDSLIGTGQLPKFEDDLFKLTDDRYLISTAEIPLTNLFRDNLIDSKDLPKKVTAHTPCFRSEAGSYGKDTRGLIRQHQFEKVELVQIVHPNESENALQDLLSNAETILQKLGLPYQVVQLCGGDLGFSSAKTYDIEVWLPSQEKYREISSCSSFTDFQARRANIKIKENKAKFFAHTINGSGLAVGRCLVAILENYYDENTKKINLPSVITKYTGFDSINT